MKWRLIATIGFTVLNACITVASVLSLWMTKRILQNTKVEAVVTVGTVSK